jgi:hypothetical protein
MNPRKIFVTVGVIVCVMIVFILIYIVYFLIGESNSRKGFVKCVPNEKCLTGLHNLQKVHKNSPVECYRIPITDTTPIVLATAPSHCTVHGRNYEDEEVFMKKIAFMRKTHIESVMTKNLNFVLCCPLQRSLLWI